MSLFRREILVEPQIIGVTNGSVAPAGQVGETVQVLVPIGSAVSLSTGTAANVMSLKLNPGSWNVEGNINYTATSASVTAGSLWAAGTNTVSATLPTDGSEVQELATALTTTTFKQGIGLPAKVYNISTPTTIYLVTSAAFTAGSVAAYGSMIAERIR